MGRWRTFEGHFHDHRGDPHVDAIVLNGIDRTREARLTEGLAEAQPLEALGVLAGGLAHDLNNILTVVASHAELLAADADLDERGRDDVAAIRAASDRAQTLTRGLLTLSRRKQGPVAAVPVSAVVRDAVRDLPHASIAVAQGTAGSVLADPAAVTQVVEGLLEASRDGAGHAAVEVSVGERQVDEADAAASGVEPRLYVNVTVGAPFEADVLVARDEAVRVEPAREWDLAPGDLALLSALAACREMGGTVLRERQGERTRYAALLPAVHQ
jgi:signal transduction histidine kinase